MPSRVNPDFSASWSLVSVPVSPKIVARKAGYAFLISERPPRRLSVAGLLGAYQMALLGPDK